MPVGLGYPVALDAAVGFAVLVGLDVLGGFALVGLAGFDAAVELLLDGYVPAAGVDVEAVLAGGFIVFDVIAPLVLPGAVPPAACWNCCSSRRTSINFALIAGSTCALGLVPVVPTAPGVAG